MCHLVNGLKKSSPRGLKEIMMIKKEYKSPVEALEKARDIWQWMIDNKSDEKCDAYMSLGFEENDLDWCPACQWNYENNVSCHEYGKLPHVCIINWGGYLGCSGGSPYDNWCDFPCPENAQKVLNCILQSIQEAT